jgi:acetamidase/formamidase
MTSPMTNLGVILRDRPAASAAEAGEMQHVPTTPTTVVWGCLPIDRAPIAVVASDTSFRLDTVSHRGLIEGTDPVTFFGKHGVDRDRILTDAIVLHAELTRPDGADGHLLTGPVSITGTEPGDALEVLIHAADLRVDHGVNASRPGQGLLPELLKEPSVRVLRTTADGTRIVVAPGISVPVAPFPGFIGTAPPESAGRVGSRVPGNWGGNLDVRWLTAGSSIVLPVARPGGLLYVGDPHAAQGHGEVNGTAVEHSATFVLEARIHRGLAPTAPIVLTPDAVVCLGVAEDPRAALRAALLSAIDLLRGWSDGEIGEADAYALCSIAADAGFAEVVNGADVAYVAIPRDVLPDRG